MPTHISIHSSTIRNIINSCPLSPYLTVALYPSVATSTSFVCASVKEPDNITQFYSLIAWWRFP
ncbi:hypothetical protein GBAR_LOCUS5224 [Geodia barretti]|uniref:Uncharacterized protein n=3 Tax=Geodia barretti TaxID=519541 RepID=A0AA35R9T4_GEOBA|nr:hypothetical protein GBAR_LOCUS5224 [Geodia barretti]